MEEKNFQYVENFVCIELNPKKIDAPKEVNRGKITNFFKSNPNNSCKSSETSCEDKTIYD